MWLHRCRRYRTKKIRAAHEVQQGTGPCAEISARIMDGCRDRRGLRDRFEFVTEDHPDPMNRLNSLQGEGGLAIGLAGVKSSEGADRAFKAHAPRNCLGYIPFRGNKNARHRSKTRDHSLRGFEGS